MSDNNDGLLKSTFVSQSKGYLDVSTKRELWKTIANNYDGTFKINLTSSNVLEILKIQIPYKNYAINITESDTRPLKFEIEFNSLVNYNLLISHEDTIEKLLKKLGKKEIEIGNSNFDNKYLIQSKDNYNTINLLSYDVAELILKCDVYSISYTTNTKQNSSCLQSIISRLVKDKQTIEDLISLHFKMIDNLEKLKLVSGSYTNLSL